MWGLHSLAGCAGPWDSQPRTDSHADRSNRAFLASLDGNNARSCKLPHNRPTHRAFLLNSCSGSEPTDGPRPTHGRLRDGVWNPLYIAPSPHSAALNDTRRTRCVCFILYSLVANHRSSHICPCAILTLIWCSRSRRLYPRYYYEPIPTIPTHTPIPLPSPSCSPSLCCRQRPCPFRSFLRSFCFFAFSLFDIKINL